ncbi:MTP-1 family protein [Paenibacillus humicola]|uniref:MTP-1 family protein n=1 Tax=Paenibacillus humicola TaxID=3110540 RepID=UPI00237C4348|nr:DUF1861 family protein [Paenibacillus humicola]
MNRGERASHPQRIVFSGVGEKDVYNISAPFKDEGEWIIAGRVESRDSEHSDVIFFVERDGRWLPREGAPTFELQDPFHCMISGELVVGGVQIFPHPEKLGGLMWRTVFYRGARLSELRPFFSGPDGMKDLRLVGLADGSVGVFTRPQGEKGGRGKIGFTRVPSLDALTIEAIGDAPLLDGQFTDEEWGGANEAHLLRDGRIGVLGHIACFGSQGDRHYYPMAFIFDPETGSYSPAELLAVRDDFLPGPSKRPDLQDVVFSGGLVRGGDGLAVLFAGISDADAQRITVRDPFYDAERGS